MGSENTSDLKDEMRCELCSVNLAPWKSFGPSSVEVMPGLFICVEHCTEDEVANIANKLSVKIAERLVSAIMS